MIPIISYHFYSYARFFQYFFCILAWFFVNGVGLDSSGSIIFAMGLVDLFFLSRFECREIGSGHIITRIADSR